MLSCHQNVTHTLHLVSAECVVEACLAVSILSLQLCFANIFHMGLVLPISPKWPFSSLSYAPGLCFPYNRHTHNGLQTGCPFWLRLRLEGTALRNSPYLGCLPEHSAPCPGGPAATGEYAAVSISCSVPRPRAAPSFPVVQHPGKQDCPRPTRVSAVSRPEMVLGEALLVAAPCLAACPRGAGQELGPGG